MVDARILSLKYRPRTWGELVGNRLFVEMLRNSVVRGDLKPAYFFSGSRGSGKTSTVRIFAKAIQCEKHCNGDPCNDCESCRAVDRDAHPDVLEVDAASQNGVDHIRELTESLQYAPTLGKARVIILDEVHSLSQAAGNALLKSLEEPPAHVHWAFCTTDPDRVLDTVLSRCLRFDFRRLTVADIQGRLEEVARLEGMTCDGEALGLIAGSVNGALRDALTYLDQARLLNPERITVHTVEEILGFVPFRDVLTLFDAVAAQDIPRALVWLDTVAADKAHVNIVLSVLSFLNQLVLLKAGAGKALKVPEELRMMSKQVAAAFELGRLVELAAGSRAALADLRRRVIPDTSVVVRLLVASFMVSADRSAQVIAPSMATLHKPEQFEISPSTLLRRHFDGEVLRVEDL